MTIDDIKAELTQLRKLYDETSARLLSLQKERAMLQANKMRGKFFCESSGDTKRYFHVQEVDSGTYPLLLKSVTCTYNANELHVHTSAGWRPLPNTHDTKKITPEKFYSVLKLTDTISDLIKEHGLSN